VARRPFFVKKAIWQKPVKIKSGSWATRVRHFCQIRMGKTSCKKPFDSQSLARLRLIDPSRHDARSGGFASLPTNGRPVVETNMDLRFIQVYD
jgi:hypothetical protein